MSLTSLFFWLIACYFFLMDRIFTPVKRIHYVLLPWVAYEGPLIVKATFSRQQGPTT
jgi:hypothetical protein